MLPLRTTTTGDSDSVTTMSPFHIISAEQTIMAKLSTWCASCTRDNSESLPCVQLRGATKAGLPLAHVAQGGVHVHRGVHGSPEMRDDSARVV